MANLRYVGPSRKDLAKLGIKPGSLVFVPDWMVINDRVVIPTLFEPISVPLSRFSDDELDMVSLEDYMISLTRQFD